MYIIWTADSADVMWSKGDAFKGGGGGGGGSVGFDPILQYNINCFWKVMKKRSNKKESIRMAIIWVRDGGRIWMLTYFRGLRFFESAWLNFFGMVASNVLR